MISSLPSFDEQSTSKVRLFCFPHAGGGTFLYRPWRRIAPSELEILPVLLPGREARIGEPLCTNLHELIDSLLGDLVPLFLEKPFAFFGHSMGSLIAFEIARALRTRAYPFPQALFVSAFKAPHLPSEENQKLHLLSEERLFQRVSEFGGFARELFDHPELLKIVMPVIRADLEMVETYSYRDDSPLDSPILAFAGSSDLKVRVEEVEGWRGQTQSYFELNQFAGDHFYLNNPEARGTILGRIASFLLSHDTDRSNHR